MKSFLLGCTSLMSLPLVATQLPTVDFLRESVDRATLVRIPKQSYTTQMWRSYERFPVAKDKPSWFGNVDDNQFVRIDQVVTKVDDQVLAPNASTRISLKGAKAVRSLRIKLVAKDLEQALRSTVISMTFDGDQTVWSPVGAFFGTGHSIRPVKTDYNRVDADGTLETYWVMPFAKHATIKVHNYSSQSVTVEELRAATSDWLWDDRSMHFGVG